MAGEPVPPFLFAGSIPNASRTAFSFQHPASVDETTICIVTLDQDGSGGVPSAPDGTWTAVSGSPFVGTGGNRLSCWWKRMSKDDRGKGTGNFSWTTADFSAATYVYYKGCPQSGDPQDVAAAHASTTTVTLTIAGVTTVTDNCRLVIAQGEQDVGNTHTGPGQERIDIGGAALYEDIQASAGATGNKVVTASGATAQAGFLIALKPGTESKPMPGTPPSTGLYDDYQGPSGLR